MQNTLTTIILIGLTAALSSQDHGQGPVAKGPIKIDDLKIGEHWFGAPTDLQHLVGKVVLVEIWGS